MANHNNACSGNILKKKLSKDVLLAPLTRFFAIQKTNQISRQSSECSHCSLKLNKKLIKLIITKIMKYLKKFKLNGLAFIFSVLLSRTCYV